jgi:hypothetical protein
MQGMLAQVSRCVSGSTTPAIEKESRVGCSPVSAMIARKVAMKVAKSSTGVGCRPSGVMSVSERAMPPLMAEPPISKEMIIRILLVREAQRLLAPFGMICKPKPTLRRAG